MAKRPEGSPELERALNVLLPETQTLSEMYVSGLGHIKIFRDPEQGNCVDINGKRAWSHWREPLPMMQLTIREKIREWEYLNSFKQES